MDQSDTKKNIKSGEPSAPDVSPAPPSSSTAIPTTNTPTATTSNFPPSSGPQPISYPSRNKTYLSQLYNQPILTTLSSFSHVADYVRSPYELLNNFDEFVKQASGNSRKQQRTSENFVRSLNQPRQLSTPDSHVLQELDTFAASPHDQSPEASSSSHNQSDPLEPSGLHKDQDDFFRLSGERQNRPQLEDEPKFPIPALPSIDGSVKRGRIGALTIEEYESKFRSSSSDLELIERVFYGSMENNTIRSALWPYLFGIVHHRGSFKKSVDNNGELTYIYDEHDANIARWKELKNLYYAYESQWRAIMSDQEIRFTAFRERKSLIERDVIRCDRLHPFYAEKPEHLSTLTELLMTYMMYDFDIGYVQGMSDLAGPVLYMHEGDLIKSFWTFVEVMKLFRRNFELTQKTIHFQLSCLYELIKHTDPMFAQYLEEHQNSNCFFAFRPIVCQFKRELMKEDEDDYTKVLFLWDTIWCVERMNKLRNELGPPKARTPKPSGSANSDVLDQINVEERLKLETTPEQATAKDDVQQVYTYNPDQVDTPRHRLTETETFVLALCLSLIRRERDIILSKRLDDTDIHLHFIDPKLANDLKGFIEHAINIYSFLKCDFDLKKLTHPEDKTASDGNADSPPVSSEGYDLLNDFLLVSGCPE